MRVAELYERECARLGYQPDPAQARVVALFDELRDRLIAAKPRGLLGNKLRNNKLIGGLLSGGKLHELQRGVYVWGGVGRGKTWLMDLFFQSLPFRDKQRSHFHRCMQSVHDELTKHKEQANPLDRVAD
ncbi:MAG: AFG1/ZapE family ATPase, partial [Steroidobacteraceae bacterium]